VAGLALIGCALTVLWRSRRLGGYAAYPQEYEQRVVDFFDTELLGARPISQCQRQARVATATRYSQSYNSVPSVARLAAAAMLTRSARNACRPSSD
jgi:hypothetical protein